MSKCSPAARHHAVAAGHEAGRRRQRHAAGIFERFARLERRLLADHAGALDLLQPPERVGDAPMARLELHRLGPQIGDVDGVGPEEIAVARRRPLGNEAGRHRDLDLAGYGAIHLSICLTIDVVWAWSFDLAARDYGRKTARKKSRSWPRYPTERDLRLDLFRGIALWLIFLDHIPSNAVSWITIRNYGFSDATEIFVFISGYTAAFVYGRAMREHGFIVAERARAQARLADLCRARVSVRDLSRRNRLCRAQLRQSALHRGNGRARFSQAIRTSRSFRRCC